MRCHSQYKAFKQTRVDAQNDSEVATVQIDWSESVKMKQAREEKKAYYDEVQISIHAMYVWTVEMQQSFVAMSDHTDHKAPVVMISIKPILEKLIKQEKKLINIISDSPTSQYRTVKCFTWFNNLQKITE